MIIRWLLVLMIAFVWVDAIAQNLPFILKLPQIGQTKPSALVLRRLDSIAREDGTEPIVDQQGQRIYYFKSGAEAFEKMFFKGSEKERAEVKETLRSLKNNAEGLNAILSSFIDERAQTTVYNTKHFSQTELSHLRDIFTQMGLKSNVQGHALVVGEGYSYELMKGLLLEGSQLSDPTLRARYQRVIRFIEGTGFKSVYDKNQGAAAYYDPGANEMAFVMPSRANLDSLTHELSHARFNKWMKRYSSWVEQKDWAIPYEIDGPSLGRTSSSLNGRGGYNNLLNEVNSWRIGKSFEGKNSDEEILKTLKTYYGKQAGEEAVQVFQEVWSVDKIKDKTIPYLIYAKTRELNALSDEEILKLGQKSLSNDDRIGQENFIRLVKVRNSLTLIYKNQVVDILRSLNQRGKDEVIHDLAMQELRKVDPSLQMSEKQQAEFRTLSGNAQQWMNTIRDKKKLPPEISSPQMINILYFTKQGNYRDPQDLLQEYEEKFPGALDSKKLEMTEKIRTMLSPEGGTIEQRIKNYLKEKENQSFSLVWDGFKRAPNPYLTNLLIEKHLDQIRAREVDELIGLYNTVGREKKSNAEQISLIVDSLMERNGLIVNLRSREIENDNSSSMFFEQSQERKKQKNWFANQLDKSLVKVLYSGLPENHLMGVVNKVIQNTLPEEFPRLYKATTDLIISDKSESDGDKNRAWIARQFLMAESNFEVNTPWQDQLLKEVEKDKTPSNGTQEAAAEAIRKIVGDSFGELQWGQLLGTKLDQMTRVKALDEIQSLSIEDAKRFQNTMNYLWKLAGDDSSKVRIAALYAMVTHPHFAVALEGEMLIAHKNKDPRYQQVLAHLIDMSDPGFLPKLQGRMSQDEAKTIIASFVPEKNIAPKASKQGGGATEGEKNSKVSTAPVPAQANNKLAQMVEVEDDVKPRKQSKPLQAEASPQSQTEKVAAKESFSPLQASKNAVAGYGTFVAAQVLKDGFYLAVDGMQGKSDYEEFTHSIKEMGSKSAVAGYSTFAVTAGAVNKTGEMALGKMKSGSLKTGLKSGIGAVAMASAMQADQIARSTMKRIDAGDDFNEAVKKAATEWSQGAELAQMGVAVGAFKLARPAAQLTTEAGKAAYDFIKARRAVQLAGTAAATAQASTGVGVLTAVTTMAGEFIIAEGILRGYEKLYNEEQIRKRLMEISGLINNMNESNVQGNYEKIAQKFQELRDLRKAWVIANVPEVKKTFRQMEELFLEVYKEQNYFRKFKPGMLFQKQADGKYFVYNPQTQKFEEDLPFNQCLKDIQKIEPRELGNKNCLSDFTACRHLTMMKRMNNNLMPKLKELDAKRAAFERVFQSHEKNEIEKFSPLKQDFYSASHAKFEHADARDSLIEAEVYKHQISQLSTMDLYQMERIALHDTLMKANLKIQKNSQGQMEFARAKEGEKALMSEEKIKNLYAQANNEVTAASEIFVNLKPQTLMSEDDNKNCEPTHGINKLAGNMQDIVGIPNATLASILADTQLWTEAAGHYAQGRKSEGTNTEQCTARAMNCALAQGLGIEKAVKDMGSSDNCSKYYEELSLSDRAVLEKYKNFGLNLVKP